MRTLVPSAGRMRPRTRGVGRRGWQAAYDLSTRVLEAHPYARQVVPVHLATAVHLHRTSDLFLLGHRFSPPTPAPTPRPKGRQVIPLWVMHMLIISVCHLVRIA